MPSLLIIIPIGPLISALGSWFHQLREKLTRDSRNPYIKTDIKTFGFADMHTLPTPENDAVARSAAKIAEKDYETAKHVLINAWLLIPQEGNNDGAFICLKEGFVNLYLAKGEQARAEHIAALPILLLDREIQWIITHPDQQICGSKYDVEGQDGDPPMC